MSSGNGGEGRSLLAFQNADLRGDLLSKQRQRHVFRARKASISIPRKKVILVFNGCRLCASSRLWALLAESLSLSIVFWSSSEESNLMAESGVKVAGLN